MVRKTITLMLLLGIVCLQTSCSQTADTIPAPTLSVKTNEAKSETDEIKDMEETMSDNSSSKNIVITIDDIVVTAELDDSEIARQFVSLLPQTISMTRGRDREYYGGITGSLDYDEKDIVRTAKDGELGYWFSGNSLAFFFNTENDSAVNSGIVVFGKIISDLSVFDHMDSDKTMIVTVAE